MGLKQNRITDVTGNVTGIIAGVSFFVLMAGKALLSASSSFVAVTMKCVTLVATLWAVPVATAFISPSITGRRPVQTNLFAKNEEKIDRRSFVWTAAAASLALALPSTTPSALADGGVDYKAVSADIAALIKKNPDWGPTFVRLAWHSSGTYS